MNSRLAGRRPKRSAFTILELQMALVVMFVGLLGIQALLIRQSRQVERLDQWCQADRTYYVVPQSEEWMLTLGAPADLNAQAGLDAWTPPVTGRTVYTVTLTSFSRSLGAGTASAQVVRQRN